MFHGGCETTFQVVRQVHVAPCPVKVNFLFRAIWPPLQVAILALKGAKVKSLSVKGTGAKGCTLKRRAFQSAPVADCININLLCHSKYQLLIQRLVLFFYPILGQKYLRHRLMPIIFSNCFFSKDSVTQHKPVQRAFRFLRRFFLPHCQLLSIDGNFTNCYQRCSLWESLTSVYGCRSPYIYWIFRDFYGIVKP